MRALLAAGADVVRLNAAHGTADVHAQRAALARATAAALGSRRRRARRSSRTEDAHRSGRRRRDRARDRRTQLTLTVGARSSATRTASRRRCPSSAGGSDPATTSSSPTARSCCASNASSTTTCVCEIVRGGMLRSRKGMHVPRAEAHVESFTETDAVALRMAIAIKADFIGLSFVRRPEDVEAVRARLPKRGHRPQLVAKIETAVALDHLPGIVGAADAVMVARGDLGIQVPARRVPLIQKEIIRFCNMAGQAGDHRDPDARVDDPFAAADARRGQRRRQRGARRHRRARCSRRRPPSASTRPTPCAR